MKGDLIINFLLIVLIGVSIYWDIRYRRIPNIITLPAILGGFLLNAAFGSFDGFLSSLYGFLIGTAILFIPFVLGGMGGGDVKLLAAIGGLIGYPSIINTAIYGIMTGGVIALLILIRKRAFYSMLRNWIYALCTSIILKEKHGPERKTIDTAKEGDTMPYGVAIGVGAIIALIIEQVR